MITSETPYKMVEIIHDTWPQLFRPGVNSSKKHDSVQTGTSKHKKCRMCKTLA